MDRLQTLQKQIGTEELSGLIRDLIDDDWTDSEIRRYCRCTEEANPELPEDTALRRMKLEKDAVMKRLGRPTIQHQKG